MGLSLTGVVLLAGSFNLRTSSNAQRGTLVRASRRSSGFLVFMIAGLAETHRLPFDLPESEAELVAGYHSEYSGMKFGMFFVGEYVGIVVMSAFIATFFFGGWLGPWLPPIVWFLAQDRRLRRLLRAPARLHAAAPLRPAHGAAPGRCCCPSRC